ncbi:hypothetical protein JCM21900_000048 [Sporobolomyces salmonicolor]
MPRPTRTRTSLPGHSRAAKLESTKTISTPDALDDSYMMDPVEMAPIQAPKTIEVDQAPAPPLPPQGDKPLAPKQTKAEKAHAKRQALLDKITAGSTPYSKSHGRRLKRAARPSNNLVTTLAEFEEVLPQIEPESEEEEDGMEEEGVPKKQGTGGKGKEKLTAKKRQRVLTTEAARLPAILANSHFASSPFATIRQHTLNTMATQKNEPPAKKKAGKAKK